MSRKKVGESESSDHTFLDWHRTLGAPFAWEAFINWNPANTEFCQVQLTVLSFIPPYNTPFLLTRRSLAQCCARPFG